MYLLCLWSFHGSINCTTYLNILWDLFVLQTDNLGLTAQVCFEQDKTANFAIGTWKFLSKVLQDTWFFHDLPTFTCPSGLTSPIPRLVILLQVLGSFIKQEVALTHHRISAEPEKAV